MNFLRAKQTLSVLPLTVNGPCQLTSPVNLSQDIEQWVGKDLELF